METIRLLAPLLCQERTLFISAKATVLQIEQGGDTEVVVRNPRVWIYLVVGLMAAGLIGYSQWRDSDAQRLQRCIDASIAQMKQDTPALAKFDNAQPALVEMSRASCIRQLGINPQTK